MRYAACKGHASLVPLLLVSVMKQPKDDVRCATHPAAMDSAKDDATRSGAAAAAAAVPAAAVPADVAAMLARLALSQHGAALCERLGVAFLCDVAALTDAELQEGLPAMKVAERRRLLAAAKKAGGLGALAAARA